jgi:hypothetical protein
MLEPEGKFFSADDATLAHSAEQLQEVDHPEARIAHHRICASPDAIFGSHNYVSRPLIANNQTEQSAGLRIPAGEIERLVTSRARQWLLDPGNFYQAAQLADLSAQRRLIARAEEIGKSWSELPVARQRALLTALT